MPHTLSPHDIPLTKFNVGVLAFATLIFCMLAEVAIQLAKITDILFTKQENIQAFLKSLTVCLPMSFGGLTIS
jgi:hypothetical protein